ncbi:MAG: hypothetical protein IT529_06310 [Burkholderiales bacterium]|nr:hypothetical protein [Burkholderiales bacterium]
MTTREQLFVVFGAGAGATLGAAVFGADLAALIAGWVLALVPFLWVHR